MVMQSSPTGASVVELAVLNIMPNAIPAREEDEQSTREAAKGQNRVIPTRQPQVRTWTSLPGKHIYMYALLHSYMYV